MPQLVIGRQYTILGADFRVMKNVKLQTGNLYSVSIWDTAGSEQFKSIVKFSCQVTVYKYIKGSDGAIICFDLTEPKSIKSVKEWYEYVR